MSKTLKQKVDEKKLTEKVIVCDECKKEFLARSVQIKETSVEVAGTVLTLDYFTCPRCHAVYKVLLVDDVNKYRELVDDLCNTRKRISRLNGKGNSGLIEQIQKMLERKQGRIKKYVDSVSEKYPGSFVVLATENKQQDETIKYLPREDADE